MSDSLLPYYNRELDALRRLSGEFADTHPKVAGRLRLAPDTVDDPHVERLLEGVAFLSDRTEQRHDDDDEERNVPHRLRRRIRPRERQQRPCELLVPQQAQ